MGPPSTVSEYISPSAVLSVDIDSGSRSLIGEPPLHHPRRRLVAPVGTDPSLPRRLLLEEATGHWSVAASYQTLRPHRWRTGMILALASCCRDQDEDGAQLEHRRDGQGRRRPEQPRLALRRARWHVVRRRLVQSHHMLRLPAG